MSNEEHKLLYIREAPSPALFTHVGAVKVTVPRRILRSILTFLRIRARRVFQLNVQIWNTLDEYQDHRSPVSPGACVATTGFLNVSSPWRMKVVGHRERPK